MRKPKISVIIPVYNAEKYISRSIESVLIQLMIADIEIICVDDGSTDNSSRILDEYAKQFNQVKVIHQSNQHLGSARNAGINIATGEYIHFLDADDFIFDNAYESIYDEAKRLDADILKFRVKTIDINTEKEISDSIYNLANIPKQVFGKVVNFSENSKYFLNWISYPPWNGIYKRKFLTENKIFFESIHTFEDHIFYYTVLLEAKNVIFSNRYVLHYCQNNPDSLVGKGLYHFNNLIDVFRILEIKTREEDKYLRYTILAIELKWILRWYNKSKVNGQNWNHVKQITQKFISCFDIELLKQLIGTGLMDNETLKLILESCDETPDISILVRSHYFQAQKESFERHFPFSLVSKAHRIVIYGAGVFGHRSVSALLETGYEPQILWIDRNYENLGNEETIISPPETVGTAQFDYLVIAIENTDIVSSVRSYMKELKVPVSKVIWWDAKSGKWMNDCK